MGLGRSLYFSGLSSVATVVVQFGVSIVVARLLTPTEIGSFGVAMAASALVRACESAGINNFVASYKALDRPLLETVFTINWVLNLLLALVLVLVAAPFGRFYGSGEVAELILLLALATAINSHQPILQGVLRRDMRFKTLMKLDIFTALVTSATTVAAILMGFGALSLAFALIIERLIANLAGLTLFRRDIPAAIRFEGARTVLKFGFALSTATIIGIIGNNAGNFILGRTLGLAPSAQFDRGFTLPRLIWRVFQPSFHNVLVPEVARRDRAGEGFERVVADVTEAFALIVWPAGLVLVLVSPEIVLTLFGDQWHQATILAPWLLLYALIYSPVSLAGVPLIVFGHGRALIMMQVAENVVRVAVLLLATVVGFQGLAYLMALPVLAYSLTVFYYLSRHGLMAPWRFLRAFAAPLRLTALSSVPTLVMMWHAEGRYLSLGELGVIVGASAVVYLGGLWFFEREFLGRMLALLRPAKMGDVPDQPADQRIG